jgi:cysteine synthase
MYFKKTINAIGHTPLVELVKTSPNEKVHILAKMEGQNLGGSASIKDRIAQFLIEKAEESGKLTRDKTIIEATSGNTGIALAWLGYQKGYKVTIVMPDNMSLERQKLMKIYKAELILTPGDRGVVGAIDTVNELASKNGHYFMADQFANPANPLAHYETTGVEILNDLPYDKIDIFIAGIGTGGTLVGTSRRLREKFPDMKVYGVEPPQGDSIQGLRCLEDYVPPILDLSLITERLKTTSQQAVKGTRHLLDNEGIFAGPSSGAVVYQAMKLAEEMDEGNIVVILADAGWKYMSMDLWTDTR